MNYLTAQMKRLFFVLIGFAATSAIILLSVQSAHAEAALKSEDFDFEICEQKLIRAEFEVQLPNSLDVNSKIAMNLLQTLRPQLFVPQESAEYAKFKANSLTQSIREANRPIKRGNPTNAERFSYGLSLQDEIHLNAWGSPREFWQQFGLGEAYLKMFPTDNKFYQSNLSLVVIYKELYRRQVNANLYGYLSIRYIGEVVRFKQSSGFDGFFIALNAEEFKLVPSGTILWNAEGQRRYAGTFTADKNRIWGVRAQETLSDMGKK